jgi:hypothetical protein
MNLREKKGFSISKLVILGLVVFFILSLSIHNHAFYIGSSYADTVSQTKSTYPNHSNDFCSACRINGNINQTTWTNNLEYIPFGILIDFLNHNLLIPPSFLTSKKTPRSPPII